MSAEIVSQRRIALTKLEVYVMEAAAPLKLNIEPMQED